jgi:hypothetical protein
MSAEILILPILLAATAPLVCIRRLFQKWHRAAAPSVKHAASWCWARARRRIVPAMSVPCAGASVPETKHFSQTTNPQNYE